MRIKASQIQMYQPRFQALGIAQNAFDTAVNYALTRESMGKSISKHQMVQSKIADMALRIEQSRLMMYKAAALKDAGTINQL